MVWRAAGDVRLLSTSGYALLLQVAHPTVGAGVGDHSAFVSDPWGRLMRTLDYVHGSIYGGSHMAFEIGKRVREMHKQIKGFKPNGERYSALEPDAYAWVHATLATAFVDGSTVFGDGMTPDEKEAFWRDWVKLGRLIGVRERDLPAKWRDFRAYFDDVVDNHLEDNETVHTVLKTLERPAPPMVPGVPPRLWKQMRKPLSAGLNITTVGMLPPRLRHKLNLEYTANDARIFRAIAATSRASSPLIRGPLREFGVNYVAMRRKQLERGDVARGAPAPKSHAAAA